MRLLHGVLEYRPYLQAKLHEQKGRLLQLIYDNMGITPKTLKLPEPAATNPVVKAAGGGKKQQPQQQQQQQQSSSSQKREPFWKWGQICKFYNENNCHAKDARVCKRGNKNQLREVRVCFDKKGKFRRCTGRASRRCGTGAWPKRFGLRSNSGAKATIWNSTFSKTLSRNLGKTLKQFFC